MEITKKELRKLYYSMNNDDLCKKLGISIVTLIKYLKDAGIKLKGKGNRESSSKIKIID